MLATERFARTASQRLERFQPDCPVYAHCACLCTEQRSGAVFAQVRLLNRADWPVESVWLRIDGTDAAGQASFSCPELLTGLAAAPGAVFAEERLLPLGRQTPQRLTVTVERIALSGGLCWKRPAEQRPVTVAEAGWQRCRCGLPVPMDAARCPLCGRMLPCAPTVDAVTAQDNGAVTLCPPDETARPPEPVVCEPQDATDFDLDPDDDWEPDDTAPDAPQGVPRWLTFLFYLFGALALAAIAAVAALCVWKRVR